MSKNYWSADIDVIYNGIRYLFDQLTNEAKQRVLSEISSGNFTGRIKKADLKAVETYKQKD